MSRMQVIIAYVLMGISVFVISMQYMNKFFDWLRFQSIGTRDYVSDRLNMMFIEISPQRVLLYMTLCSVVPFLLMILIFLPNFVPGILFGTLLGVVGWFIPKPLINWMYRRKIQKFNLQMVDALSLMSNAMKSGLSVVQALGIVSEQMPDPISSEFKLVLQRNQMGDSVEESFNNLAKRVPCEDVDMFVTAVNILISTGGNLAETFDTIVYVIRERIKVENKIQALTAQSYYQGMILMSIPPGLTAYFYFTEPEYMKPMFSNPLGWAMLFGASILLVLAYITIKKVVKIDI